MPCSHSRAPMAPSLSSATQRNRSHAGSCSSSDLRLIPSAVGLLALLASGAALAQARPLNDTGQVTCYNNTVATGTIVLNTPNPVDAGFEGQDCVRGRAAADALGFLPKTGASSVRGRDYTKIANSGSELPASAALGSAPGDWACTRDNVTGLIWEVRVNDAANLRHQGHTYTWYDTDPAVNSGDPGILGTSATCNATLANCNTTARRDAVNSAGLCGAGDWRMPTPHELQSLVVYDGGAGGYDTIFLPNSSFSYWTGNTSAGVETRAWLVGLSQVIQGPSSKNSQLGVRLVRGGP